jgi:nucleobase transporter 1/2
MAADPKPEEISHPPMDQLQGLEYCIDSNPSWGMFCFFCEYQVFLACFSLLFSNLVFVEAGESIALGFQHYILALGTAVMIPSFLVPLMGGNHVSRFLLSPSSDFYVSIALKIRTLGI